MSNEIKLGLLGNGIGRSRAKALHELIGELYGLNVTYRVMDLADKSDVCVEDELKRCQSEGFRGVNVTHPYKRDAFKCVELLPGFPQGLTSINTVLLEDGQMAASNTDYSGFNRAYSAHFGLEKAPGRVLMVGSGGVGLAIAYGLMSLGATELVIFDKNVEAAQELVNSLDLNRLPTRIIKQTELVDEMRKADGLVNATPIGMFQYPGNPFPSEGFGNQKWAFDAVYTPENTDFLNRCRELNIDTLSGFKLFIYQGLDAFERFTGVDVDAQKVEALFLQRYPLAS